MGTKKKYRDKLIIAMNKCIDNAENVEDGKLQLKAYLRGLYKAEEIIREIFR